MPTRNISLTKHFDKFVAGQVREGQYRNASEVLRAGLRLLEQQARENAERLKTLRSLIDEGVKELDQGLGIKFASREELEELVTSLQQKVAQKHQPAERRSRRA